MLSYFLLISLYSHTYNRRGIYLIYCLCATFFRTRNIISRHIFMHRSTMESPGLFDFRAKPHFNLPAHILFQWLLRLQTCLSVSEQNLVQLSFLAHCTSFDRVFRKSLAAARALYRFAYSSAQPSI